MTYKDIMKHNLHNILPSDRKYYGTKKDVETVTEAIKSNREFMQFAMAEKNATYINDIISHLIKFVVVCNAVTYDGMVYKKFRK